MSFVDMTGTRAVAALPRCHPSFDCLHRTASQAAARQSRFVRLTPGCAFALVMRPLRAAAVRARFSGRSFVQSWPESLQPKALLSGDLGLKYSFPSSNLRLDTV